MEYVGVNIQGLFGLTVLSSLIVEIRILKPDLG